MAAFTLHPDLVADTHPVCDLPLCRVLLFNDNRYPWLILVPMRDSLRDLIDPSPADQATMLEEINRAGRAMKALFKPDKLNIASLGNFTPQLHIHVIARFKTDAAWPKPVWGVGEVVKYSEEQAGAIIAMIKQQLG